MTARGWLGLTSLILVLVAGGVVWWRAEGGAPRVDAPDSVLIGASPHSVEIGLIDDGAGLREARVTLAHARGEATLLEERFPGNAFTGGGRGSGEARMTVALDPGAHDLPEGDAFLRIEVRDWSWRGGFGGNATRIELPVRVDLSPPQIEVASGLTYVRRGGAGAVAYSVSEATARDGVMVGETFFRGFPPGDDGGGGRAAPGRRIALYAVATGDPPPPEIHVIAEDAAGNRARAAWPVVVQPRSPKTGNVTLPGSFLERKVRPLAQAQRIPSDDLVAAFHRINTELRNANETRIRELVAKSAGQSLWVGAFQQLPNSKVTSPFAEQRLYFVNGERVSAATHFGYDLASSAAATIAAANSGIVAFAGDLGIYGNCVLIDHGLGLASLYGHLSRIDVATGDRVEKGQRLGLSGATGLAGGDHLHFAMLVGDVYVDPLEWWDPAWVRTHIDNHLGRFRTRTAANAQAGAQTP